MSSTAMEAKEAGNAAFKNKDLDEAIKQWTIGIDNAGGDKELLKTLYSNRSAAYLTMKNSSAALLDAERCVSLDSNWAKGFTRKGDALDSLGRYIEAYNAYNSALRITPNDNSCLEKSEKMQAKIRRQNEASQSSSSSNSFSPASGLQSLLRAVIVFSIFFYILPVGRFLNLWSYRLFVISASTNYALNLYNSHGMPQFNISYAQRIIPDQSAAYLFLSLILLMSKPYLLAVAPIVLVEAAQLAKLCTEKMTDYYNMCPAQYKPMLDQAIQQVVKRPDWAAMSTQARWNVVDAKAMEMSATAEVLQGIFLVVELLLPSRSFLFTMMWWQYLQMRYMLDQKGHIKTAFSSVDGQITGFINHPYCPAAVRPYLVQGYQLIKDQLSKRVQIPAQGTPPPSMSSMLPKCTIM